MITAQFTSRENTVYRVVLESTSGPALTGTFQLGVPPFTVKYEGTSDFNKPVKMSSATIRTVINDIPWNLVTQKLADVSVELQQKNGENWDTVWCGFVDAKVYDMAADKNLEEFEINCVDCFTVLKERRYGVNDTTALIHPQVVTFYNMIKQCLSEMPYRKLYFPAMYVEEGYVTTRELEHYYVNTQVFVDKDAVKVAENGDLAFAFAKNDTYLDILESLMKYLNLTMVAQGLDVYCIPQDYLDKDVSYYVYDLQSNAMVTSKLHTSKTLDKLYQPTTYSLDEQYNQVTVTAKMKEYDSVIPDLFDDKYLTNTTKHDGQPVQYEVEGKTYTEPVTEGGEGWGKYLETKVIDDQKDDHTVTDKVRYSFFKHLYWKSNYYPWKGGEVPLLPEIGGQTPQMENLTQLRTYPAFGQIMKYTKNEVIADGLADSSVVYDTKQYEDRQPPSNGTNYVLLGMLDPNDNRALLETAGTSDVFLFPNSYFNIKYSIQFRSGDAFWWIPSSWENWKEDDFTYYRGYIEMVLGLQTPTGTWYYDNTATFMFFSLDTWKAHGTWKQWGRGEAYPPHCRIPFQCKDSSDHLYGKEWKSNINSGWAGHEDTESGFIIKPPKELYGQPVRPIIQLMGHNMKSESHDSNGTWLKELSIKLQIPKDTSIKDWKADTEYKAIISDQYTKEGEKIEMKVNTYDSRVPSYSCVLMRSYSSNSQHLANKFTIKYSSEPAHRMEEWKIYHKIRQHEVPKKILNTTIEGHVSPYVLYVHRDDSYVLNTWETDFYDNKSEIELIEI